MWEFLKNVFWSIAFWAIALLILGYLVYLCAEFLGEVVRKIRSWISGILDHVAQIIERMWESVAAAAELVTDVVPVDGLARRRRSADRLLKLSESAKRDSTGKASRALNRAARSPYGFKRTYALDAIGRLGEGTSAQVATLVKGLDSFDPFVREAAAQALYRLGPSAATARPALVKVLRLRFREGTARYAVLALGTLRDLSSDDVAEIKNASTNEFCYAMAEAAQLCREWANRLQ